MEDLIERARAIEIIHELQDSQTFDQTADMAYDLVDWAISEIPSAQPETHDKRTETHACDLINRQAAIDALTRKMVSIPTAGEKDLMGDVNRIRTEDISAIRRFPSAQPEPCVDTIDALDESIKHFDDMAEECRRNANIEQNDYMDMRDDAAECRQLSIWLNELKWLRERFQSQPDLSEYSDKLWKRAYERGKAEAQQGWIPFKTRPLTEEEKEGNPDWDRIFDCILPEDGQAILISVNLRGHESVQYDEFYTDDGSYLDSGYEIGDEAVAWMPLPEPYAERRTDVDVIT